MSLTKLTTNLNNIQALPDKPLESDGYTAALNKIKFDKAGNDIKTYINDTLTPELDTKLTAIDGDIGDKDLLNTTDKTNVIAAINEHETRLDNVDTSLEYITPQIGIKTPANYSDLSIYIVGDSTSDEALGYSVTNSPTVTLHLRLTEEWFAPGKPLSGARKFTFAKSGQTLLDFINNVNLGAGINDLIAKANDSTENGRLKVIVFSLGHNGTPLDVNYNTRLAEMRTAMSSILNETDCQILLRMPNAWCTAEGITTAVEASSFLNRLYKQIANEYSRTRLLDIQSVLGSGFAYAQKVWITGETVTSGNFRINTNRSENTLGGLVYKATTSGTTGATMPTGTGVGISDGTVTWDYVGVLNSYAGDHVHLNKLGYQIVADLIGESIIKMFAIPNIATYTKKYLGKPYAEYYSNSSNPKETPILSGSAIAHTYDKLVIDIDYEKAKSIIKIKDIVKPYGAKGSSISTKIERPAMRVASTSYVLGTFISAYDQYGYPITLECVVAGTSSSDAFASLQDDQRNTYILDGTVRWGLITRYHMTQLSYPLSIATISKGTLVNIFRPFDNCKTAEYLTVPTTNYIKLATVRNYATYSEIDLCFNVVVNADTVITSSTVEVSINQTNGWAIANISDKLIVTIKSLGSASTSLLKADDIILVVRNLQTGLRETDVYLKNSSLYNRNYLIQGICMSSALQNIAGSEKPHVELLPALEANISALPTEFTGTTNKTGLYNTALYLGRTDGTLVKITVDNSNVVSATLV